MKPLGDRIFISYRRADSEGYAGRLEDTLGDYFGKHRIFRDIGGIVPGEDFKQKSEEVAARAAAVIVLIGPGWLASQAEGRQRLRDPGDLVAMEVKAALDSGHVIVPVLVQGANMPREEDLPDALKGLARRNAVSVSDASWAQDTARLAKVLSIDVRSTVERRLDWLRLAVVGLLVVPFVLMLLKVADPAFRDQAIRSVGDSRTHVFKLAPSSLAKLTPEVRGALAPHHAELEAIEERDGRDRLRTTLKEMAGLDRAADVEAVMLCCTWSVADRKKAQTQAFSTLGAFCVVTVCLLLGLTRTWIEPSRRRYVWAAIAVGCVGVAGAFFYYLYNVEDSPYIWPSDEYFGIIATSIIIGLMLGLLALSGFKANDGVR